MSKNSAPFEQNPAIKLWQLWERGEQPDIKLFVESSKCDSVDQLIEILQVDQIQRWGNREQIQCEDYVDQFPILDLQETESQLLDLIYSEICIREDSGEPPTLDEYLARFPSLTNELKQQFQIHYQFGRNALSDRLGLSLQPHLLSQAPSPNEKRDQQALQTNHHLQLPQIPGYEIIELLNRGGMGIIYKARQNNLNRLVAIKMILPGVFTSENDHIRFSQEAEMIANLHHPNIVAVHEIGSLEYCQYFSMDFVNGVTLDSLFQSHGMEPQKASHFLILIARALDYAHQQGVIHRDLKPANIMVDQKGEPRILDFGLSIKLDSSRKLSHTGMIVGTLTHMSPEQAMGDRAAVGPTSDIYSLGSIFYEMLTGQLPFIESVPAVLLQKIIAQEPKSPRMVNSSVPKDLDTICQKCLSKKPALRFNSAAELADEVERFLRDEPILSRPISITNRVYRWGMRNPVISSLMALVVLLLSVGTTVSTYFAYESFKKEKETAKALIDLEREQERVIAAQKQAEKVSLTARRNLYANQMTLALQAIEMGNVNRAIDLLNRQWPASGEEDLRGFDWYCLWQFLLSEKMAFKSSISRILNLAYSPDGNYLLGTGEDYSSALWDSRSGELLKTLTTSQKIINKVIAFSPDGKYIFTGFNHIFVWEAATGELLKQIKLRGGATVIALSPNSPVLALSQTDYESTQKLKEIALWNYETGTLVREIGAPYSDPNSIRDLRFSPDGKYLVSCGQDKQIKFWNPNSGELIKILNGHKDLVSEITFLPDGNTLVSGSWDGTVKLWNLTTWTCFATLQGHQGIVRSVDASHDGKIIASAGQDRNVVLWDVNTLKQLTRLKGHPQMIWRVRFSPDDQTLASCSDDVRVRGDASSTAAGSDVRLWDVKAQIEKKPQASWKRRSSLSWKRDTWVIDLAYLPSEKVLVSAHENNRINFWNPLSGELLNSIDTNSLINDIDISSTEGHIAVACNDNVLRLYSPDSYKETLWKIPGQNKLNAVAYHPHSLTFAIAGDASVCLYDNQGNLLHQLPKTPGAVSLDFSPDGNTLAIAVRECVELWDWQAKKCNLRTESQRHGYLTTKFSPDGKYLLTVGNNKNVFVRDARSLQIHVTLTGHVSNAINGTFSPDSRRIATGAEDGTCRIWNTFTGAELLTLRGTDEHVNSLCFSLDGNSLFNGLRGWKGDKYGQIRAWHTCDDKSILKYLQKQFQDDPSQINFQIALALINFNIAQKRELPEHKRKQYLETGKIIATKLINSGRLTEQQKKRLSF